MQSGHVIYPLLLFENIELCLRNLKGIVKQRTASSLYTKTRPLDQSQ